MKFERKKKRNLLLSVLYRLHKILPLSNKKKLTLYLDLSWIFSRLANETSFKVYADDEHPFRIKGTEFLLDGIQYDHAVLDLGCKYGSLSRKIGSKAKYVLGVDLDEKAIEKAKNIATSENVEFKFLDAFDYLDSNPNKFDVIILSHILEHLDDPDSFLKICATYSKKIYIELPDFESSFLNEFRKDSGNSLIYTDEDHISEFDRDEMKTLIQEAGLDITEAEYKYGNQKYWCKSRSDV